MADIAEDEDGYDLQRFVSAQAPVYAQIVDELRRGRKRSHWMWFVFPQIAGLGHSAMARRYALRSLAEARAYLAHPVLGSRLRVCITAALVHRHRSAETIFGAIDAVKFRSSMTLFAAAAEEADAPFRTCLNAFFDGKTDDATVRLLHG